MTKIFELKELAIAIVAKNHNPTILNPDFLKCNKIVPDAWELASNPICAEPVAQIVYKNGITIAAEFNRLIFVEDVTGKQLKDFLIPEIAIKYIGTLPHVNYTAMGLNPKGHIVMSSEAEANEYVLDRIVSRGPWDMIGETKARAALRFIYPLKEHQLTITMESGIWNDNDRKAPVIIVAGNFHNDINDPKDRITMITNKLREWKKDIDAFTKLVASYVV